MSRTESAWLSSCAASRSPLSGAVIDEAADLDETTLRSLDAIHLASALSIQAELTAFIAYDHRLAEAASTAGLEPLAPGT